MAPIQTVFLDRDGVINRDDPGYIKSWGEFAFIPGSRKAIVRLSRAAVSVILITNQSMINRGMVPLERLLSLHRNLEAAIAAAGGHITDIYVCPHRPDEHCSCRKPAPGMILSAAKRHRIDLSASVMVGDSAKDILAGKTAGCGLTVLVRTGNGRRALVELEKAGHRPDHVAEDLRQATDWILLRCGT